jgi:hypothetical protein
MEEYRDELDEASYRLMMDIQTGRMVNTSRPPRGWMLLGIVTVMLGGLAGLLVASGHLTSEPSDSKRNAESTFPTRVHQPRPTESRYLEDSLARPSTPEAATSLVDQRAGMVAAEGIQPDPGRNTEAKPRSISAPSAGTKASKPARVGTTRVSNPNRECDCPVNGRTRRVVQKRSMELSLHSSPRKFQWRSVLDDFDPNAELVRSTP